jgi:hypothetical protein
MSLPIVNDGTPGIITAGKTKSGEVATWVIHTSFSVISKSETQTSEVLTDEVSRYNAKP